MSLLRNGASKLKHFTPMIQQPKRSFNYGYTHVIGSPPQNRIPFAEKMFMGTIFIVGLHTYPLYVTYMMPIWDEMDENF